MMLPLHQNHRTGSLRILYVVFTYVDNVAGAKNCHIRGMVLIDTRYMDWFKTGY